MKRACFACGTLHGIGEPCPNRRNWGGRHSQRLRRAVYDRDRGMCQLCDTPHFVPFDEFHCDHKITRGMGGSDEMDNLQTACAKSNLAKGNA
jgi:5-methylcytosine-specific restriction endonuclease McrA